MRRMTRSIIGSLLALLIMLAIFAYRASRTIRAGRVVVPSVSNQSSDQGRIENIRVVSKANEPISVLELNVREGPSLSVKVKNVSEKSVRLVAYTLNQPNCQELAYKADLWVLYGDRKLMSPNDKTPADPVLKQGENAVIVFTHKALDQFLRPTTYASCSPDSNRPSLSLAKVYFDDGTIWDASKQTPQS